MEYFIEYDLNRYGEMQTDRQPTWEAVKQHVSDLVLNEQVDPLSINIFEAKKLDTAIFVSIEVA